MQSLEDYLTQTIDKAVKDAVAEAMKDIHKEIRKGVTPAYLTKQRVMEITGWSGRTLQHMRDTNQIDFVQHGRKVLYPTDALYEFFENHRVTRRRR